MNLNTILIDETLADAGVKKPFGDGSVTLRHRSSTTFKNIVKRIFEPYASSISLGILTDEQQEELTVQVAAEGSIVTWTGFSIGDEPLEPTLENKIMALKRFKVLRDFVESESSNIENFKSAQENAETKNS